MKSLFDKVSATCSRVTTNTYSTSFSLGIRGLNRKLHAPIYGIYGYVRFADEIVDSFQGYPRADLLERFRQDTYRAIEDKISLNPILNSFQQVVHDYGIDRDLIDTFLHSMEMDLHENTYDQAGFEQYILGSAEVVGLMCLKVFVEGDQEQYLALKSNAISLGSAFQKINFLRDMHADYVGLGRAYFPGLDIDNFDQQTKRTIEADIEQDFRAGFEGIKRLPKGARFGVYLAYMYYYALFRKIKGVQSHRILSERIRIPDQHKYALMVGSYVRHQLNVLRSLTHFLPSCSALSCCSLWPPPMWPV